MIYAFDDFELDAERLQLRRAGRLIKLESSALRLLAALVARAGELLSKDELVAQIWQGRPVADNVITVAMARLRKALSSGRAGRELVNTVYGQGYRFARGVVVRPYSVNAEARPSSVPSELPYVGRERVLTRLREALRGARAGHGCVCVLTGEPGIGKTRAVEMLERELDGTPVRVAWGYCREAGETPPLWPWQELLEEITGRSARLIDPSDRSVDSGARFHFSNASLSGPAGDSSERERADSARHRKFESLLSAFTLATREAPWLLVLDDVHRADAASLELLGHLTDRVGRTHILVVATLRPAERGPSAQHEAALARVLSHRNCERIPLERLKSTEVASYVATLVDDPEGQLARSVYERSEGNPFFMTELLRQLRDADVPPPEPLQLSSAALELVRQRTARVDERTRGLLSTAAVIGRAFELAVLAEVVGGEPATLLRELDAAVQAEILVAAPSSMTAYSFSHDLLRAALYEGLSTGELRHLHLRIGEALERRAQAGSAIAASDLAYHFHAALPLGDLRRTVNWCRRAADAAIPVFAYADVARFCRHGLEALQLIERPSIKLRMNLLYLTAIYARPHDGAGYRDCVEELLRLGREHGDAEMLVRGGALLNAHPGLKPLKGAGAVMSQARDMLPAECRGLRALAHAGLASASPHCYDARAAEALAEEAVTLARDADSRGASYVSSLHQLYLIGGPAQEARADEIASLLEQLAQRNPIELAVLPVDLAYYRAMSALSRGRPDEARSALARGAAQSRQLQHAELLWHSERALALLQADLGDRDAAHLALAALHERARRSGILGSTLFCAYDRIVLLGECSDVGSLDDPLRAALQYDPDDAPAFWSLKVRALASAGLLDEARAALRTVAPARLAALPCDSQHLGTLGHLTRSALLLQEADYYPALEPLLARYPERFAAQLFSASDGSIAQLIGMLAHARGERDRAIEWLERGTQRSERAGLHGSAAEASLLLARCLLERGDDRGAARALDLARSVRASSSRLGLSQLQREAHAVLQAAGM